MKLLKKRAPEIVDFMGVQSEHGNLWCAEIEKQLPFVIKRIYYIVDMPQGSVRGAHAHKTLDQLVVAMQGHFSVDITDGENNWTYNMTKPNQALYIPGGYWRTLKDFLQGSICLVLASDPYDSSDYVRDYSDYLAWKAEHEKD